MLKQSFDKIQLANILTHHDVWKWKLSINNDSAYAISNIVNYWEQNNLTLSSLKNRRIKRKTVFHPARAEDDFAIRLLDRFIRRIYKIRQSDRNRIIKQILSLLKDSGDYHIIRLDIKNCYESINFERLINKLDNDLILAPECIRLLNDIHKDLKDNHNFDGLPRGLSISPTLAELYLEELDKKIALNPDVIYSARYVDDIIVFLPNTKKDAVEDNIIFSIEEMGLEINRSCSNKYYSNTLKNAKFDYLGYSIEVNPKDKKPNKVSVAISNSKINKIKSRIIKSFISHKINNDIALLKRRLEYISMLKVVKKGRNGDLLAGIAHNYQLVTDNFKCLKSIDGFFLQQLNSRRFGVSTSDKNKIKNISIYSNAKNKKIGNFTKNKATIITRIWENA